MSNRYTKSTTENWGSRLAGSIKGVLFGITLFTASFPVLWINEGRAVNITKGLTEGAGIVREIECNNIEKSNEGKLVHLTGQVISEEELTDDIFGISTKGLKLKRKVEMYQWEENTSTKKEKNIGGSETSEITYDYSKIWNSSTINSNNFVVEGKYFNPNNMPFLNETYVVDQAKIGNFSLSNELLNNISGYKKISLTPFTRENFQGNYSIGETKNSGYYHNSYKDSIVTSSFIYIGDGTPQSPLIGDLKIYFEELPESKVSIITQQTNNSFQPYLTENGSTISLLEMGTVSAEKMFVSAESRNTIWTWILRCIGFLMMAVGTALIFKPLVVLADVIPFIGTLLNTGISLFSSLISLVLSIFIISIAWIRYRPILGVSMLVMAIIVFIFFYITNKKRKV